MAKIDAAILKAYKKAIDLNVSPRADLYATGSLLETTMFSNGKVESYDAERTPETLIAKEDNPRVKRLAGRSRSGMGEDGETAAQRQVHRPPRRAL